MAVPHRHAPFSGLENGGTIADPRWVVADADGNQWCSRLPDHFRGWGVYADLPEPAEMASTPPWHKRHRTATALIVILATPVVLLVGGGWGVIMIPLGLWLFVASFFSDSKRGWIAAAVTFTVTIVLIAIAVYLAWPSDWSSTS